MARCVYFRDCFLIATNHKTTNPTLNTAFQLAIDKVKKQEKDGDFSEDQSRDEQDSVQKVLDKFIVELEKHLAEKEAAILKV